jgi:Fe-Mn family superoxide dismutase
MYLSVRSHASGGGRRSAQMIKLPPLPYPSNALSPVVSAVTLQEHHGQHQRRYVENTNALWGRAELPDSPLEDLIRTVALAGDRQLFNNAAQAWNHAFFWNCMSPRRAGPSTDLAEAIEAAFGDLAGLRRTFIDEGVRHFGSGWVWLAAQGDRLSVFSTHDADTAVTRDLTPLLVCDVWEHAYYLDHQHDRARFLGLWWDHLANWDFADQQFEAECEGQAGWRYPREAETYVPPIHGSGAFEHALEEAGMLLERPPEVGSEQERRFGALLSRLAEYEPAAPPVGQAGRVSADLDRRIRLAARRAQHDGGDQHWSGMVGGDLRPHP